MANQLTQLRDELESYDEVDDETLSQLTAGIVALENILTLAQSFDTATEALTSSLTGTTERF